MNAIDHGSGHVEVKVMHRGFEPACIQLMVFTMQFCKGRGLGCCRSKQGAYLALPFRNIVTRQTKKEGR